MTLPKAYADLANEPGPKMLTEALNLYGTLEVKGPGNNAKILAWADEVAAANPTAYSKWAGKWYDSDSIAWCGLFCAVIAIRSAGQRHERMPPEKYLSAVEWQKFGTMIPKTKAALGDVLIFQRTGGGHVGLYVGEDADCFHVLGGNQADSVNITRISKARLLAVRRPKYLSQPTNVRKIVRAPSGPVSANEA